MVNRAAKLRWRRRVKRSQQQVENLGSQAEQGLEKHFFKRLGRFVSVRRFVFAWVVLFGLLISGVIVQNRALSRFYQTLEPGKGGIYTEGILGAFTNANPLYAATPVDASASRLVFSGLMKYDDQNRLVGDLAEKVDVDSRGVVYTAHLREGITWHDGAPFTADDVVFTYHTIQKPDARSPLITNWQKVEIKALDEKTVQFTLPHTLASFPGSLTTGIIPEHILGKVNPTDLRAAIFNSVKPIGTGPFKWDAVQVTGGDQETREEQIGLVANENFHLGAPKLERFVIRAFHSEDALISSLSGGELSGASGLSVLPGGIDATEHSVPLMGQVMIFMKNSHPILKDKAVRMALTQATNQNEIVEGLGYPVVYSRSPLLSSHIGYNPKLVQAGFDVKAANASLEKAGWKMGVDGVRVKKKTPLVFRLYTQNDSQYAYIAQVLQKQWREVGVKVEVVLEPENRLQTTIAAHGYDSLLYGITIGADPDVYAYWHSTQADPRSASRLNLSEYKSKIADASLEAGRSRIDPDQRATKYQPFLKVWRQDAPATALYQPRFLYVTTSKLFGFEPVELNSSVDRYANVENWAVRQDRVDIY